MADNQRQENQWAIDMVRAYEAALEQLRPIYPVQVCRIEDIVAALIDGGGEEETWSMKGLSDIHLRHWQVCNCLADKAICCVPDCLCKNAHIDGSSDA